MKPETLEALLIDRSLNELSPEVGELLDAYLAQNPTAAAGAARLEEVVRLAQRAVPVPEVGQASSLSIRGTGILPVRHPWRNRLEACSTWKVFTMLRIELVRLAACLALGLALGLAVSSVWKVPATASTPSPKPVVVAKAEIESADRSSAQFWSLTEVATERQKRSDAIEPAKHERLQFDSLFKMPRLEEN